MWPKFSSLRQLSPVPDALLEHPPKDLFGSSPPVDVGMIEEIRADFLRRIEEFPSLPFVVRRQLGAGAPNRPLGPCTPWPGGILPDQGEGFSSFP